MPAGLPAPHMDQLVSVALNELIKMIDELLDLQVASLSCPFIASNVHLDE